MPDNYIYIYVMHITYQSVHDMYIDAMHIYIYA